MPVFSFFYHGSWEELKVDLKSLLPEESVDGEWRYTNGYYVLDLEGFDIKFQPKNGGHHAIGISYLGNKKSKILTPAQVMVKVEKYYAHLLASCKKFNKNRCRDPNCMGYDYGQRKPYSTEILDDNKRLLQSPNDAFSTPVEHPTRKKVRVEDKEIIGKMNFDNIHNQKSTSSKSDLLPDLSTKPSIATSLYSAL